MKAVTIIINTITISHDYNTCLYCYYHYHLFIIIVIVLSLYTKNVYAYNTLYIRFFRIENDVMEYLNWIFNDEIRLLKCLCMPNQFHIFVIIECIKLGAVIKLSYL